MTAGEQKLAAEGRAPSTVDVSRPSIARMYDYYLGGKDNFAADREAAERVLAIIPQAPVIARQNREFLGRAVRFLAESGIRQFLDIGTGLPTQDNVHQVAQRIAPDSRVVYVDNDPVACLHASYLRGCPITAIIEADVRQPEDVLGHPEVRNLIDFTQPVAVLFVAMLHCLADEDDPAGLVARFREKMAPGSYLVVSHITAEEDDKSVEQALDVYKQVGLTSLTRRSREKILGFFDGLELVEPGLVSVPDWRPVPVAAESNNRERLSTWFDPQHKLPTRVLGGVGRMP